MDENTTFSRRETLLAAGGLIAAALIPEAASAAGSGPAAVASGAISCVLTPELTEGPYYVPAEKVRRNITEGKPGAPLDLRLTVVDASTCKPIKSAVVDIWHADAVGVYSGAVAGNAGTNFMRGIQKTDSTGLARFISVYPGWYQGRAVHIHVKVHLGGTVVHTHGRGVQAVALLDAWPPRHAECSRLHLPERRQQVDAQGDEARYRLPRRDHDGRAPRLTLKIP
jgi:protocatechuate 3,4-dioxygenase beta subunit